MTVSADHLIWVDLEMTGLDCSNDFIIEIATVVTDSSLNIIAEGPNLAIYQPDAVINAMDRWNIKHHGASGLIDRVRASSYSEQQAEIETLEFLKQYLEPAVSPMCGNSICQDRRFLNRLMPNLESYFHYRNLDVSSIKILAQHWAPSIMDGYRKDTQHTALQDIYDSIDELRYYRDHFFLINGN